MPPFLSDRALHLMPPRPAESALSVFVHIPKSAGSSVNRHLSDWSWRGLRHVERFSQAPGAARLLWRADWISGHLSFEKMQALCAVTPRPARFHAVLRDPAAHVAAHANWLIEIAHRGRRFWESHPQAIRDLSERVRATDFTAPSRVIDALASAPAIFANLQSRYLLGDDIALDGTQAEARFAAYARVVPIDRLPELVTAMTGRPPRRSHRANASRWHFDRAVFATPQLQAFLAEFNAMDIAWFARTARALPAA